VLDELHLLLLVHVATDHVEDRVQDLHVKILQREHFPLVFGEGESAGVDPPELGRGGDGRHGRGQTAPSSPSGGRGIVCICRHRSLSALFPSQSSGEACGVKEAGK